MKVKIKQGSFLFLFFVLQLVGFSQLPVVQTPSVVVPTVSIYISPSGNNANPGTYASPVATFQQALQLIPFSNTADVYGEIVYLQGDYYPGQPLIQFLPDFQQGSFHKNISVRGQGLVNIYGDNMSSGSQLLWIRGSGIKVENIHFHRAKGIGILLANPNSAGAYDVSSKMTNVVLKDVSVDSAVSHSVISLLIENLMFDHVEVTNGQQENTGTNGNCHWGSALRADLCKNITIRNCHVYHNRGEGINVAASTNALVESCTAYDNFAPNFYCIRSNNVIFRKNLSYNADSMYWRNCQADNGGVPQPRRPSAGISIANEVSYSEMINNSCSPFRTHENGAFSNKIADSIFIYNNVFVLAPLIITDESTSNCLITNSNNFSNIFIENNTFIGDIAANHDFKNRGPLVYMNFDQNYFWGCLFNVDGRGVYRFENLVWKNNIVSLESTFNSQPVAPAFVLYGGRPCNGGTLPSKFNSVNNLWHHSLPQIYDHYANASIPNFLQGSTDLVRSQMITSCDPRVSLSTISPTSNSGSSAYPFYNLRPVSAYIVDDYFGNPRNAGNSNVGAIEADQAISVHEPLKETLLIYPNPSNGQFVIHAGYDSSYNIHILNLMGCEVPFTQHQDNGRITITMDTEYSGVFLLTYHSGKIKKTVKVIVNEQ
ncbi:MAG: T9SS type A sorting domain-containing protein [Bacteroidetes bacterium]|nr:T9SS type A sorting domain-containing protein [Bacteroidota bacterium]